MKPLLLALPGNEAIGERLAVTLAAEYAVPEVRNFPDGETYVRFTAGVKALVRRCALLLPSASLFAV